MNKKVGGFKRNIIKPPLNKARVIKPPEPLDFVGKSVFLAGSIEQGKAEPWQDIIAKSLLSFGVVVLNPRRDDWDSSWIQTIDNPQFRSQVEWELDAQDRADIIAMYFDPETKSPISLLELGLYAGSGKMIVCCPDGFWRKGNVDIVCKRYGIPQAEDLDCLRDMVVSQVSKIT